MTYSNPSISVILPAFNEEENLRSTVKDAVAKLHESSACFEIIIVDDGSKDGTGQVCAELEEEFPAAVHTVRHSENRGYGAALRSGFEKASKALLFFTDADGQFRWDELDDFLKMIQEADMVIGYRETRMDPWYRVLNSRIGNLLARVFLGVKVRDINCAYKLFHARLLKQLPLSSDGAFINTELLAYAANLNWTKIEIPVQHYPRLHGSPTGANLRVIGKTFVEYFKLRRRIAGP